MSARLARFKKTGSKWKHPGFLAVVISLLLLLAMAELMPRKTMSGRDPGGKCERPFLLITVLTYTRHTSLKRLLNSLSRANYGCASVDLHINIDAPPAFDKSALTANKLVVKSATELNWSHGRKSVTRRLAHKGLATSWFEISYAFDHDYILILEDDMQVSREFFAFFSLVAKQGSLSGSETIAFCLHPNDWDISVERECTDHTCSSVLYLSPEPCNWGPIWKREEWMRYLDWVFKLKSQAELPYVAEDVAFEYNDFLRSGKDVQSSWLWRYNVEFGKRQLRYSFTKCALGLNQDFYFAINHKEPGEHFERKMYVQNDPRLLVQSLHSMVPFERMYNFFVPCPFPGYSRTSHKGAGAFAAEHG